MKPAKLVGRTIANVEVRSLAEMSLWFTDGGAVSIAVDQAASPSRLVLEKPIEPPPPPVTSPLDDTPFAHPLVTLDYTNWRGKRDHHICCPLFLWHGSTDFHRESQVLLRAFVPVKGAMRDFAVADIHSVAVIEAVVKSDTQRLLPLTALPLIPNLN